MYYCCKGMDDCCKECGKLFSTPFSLCAFIVFFPAVGPFILMVLGYFAGKDHFDSCD